MVNGILSEEKVVDMSNRVRAYSYLASVLADRESDPFCRFCSSFHEKLVNVQKSMSQFERRHAEEIEGLPHDQSLLFFVAKSRISGIGPFVHPVSQKKSGNCSLPQGACFLRHSHSILQKMGQSGGMVSLVRAR